jgi:hypothetical protein
MVRTARRRRFEPYKLCAERKRTAHACATSLQCLRLISALPTKELACVCSILIHSVWNVYGSNRLEQAVWTIYFTCGADKFWACACDLFEVLGVYPCHFSWVPCKSPFASPFSEVCSHKTLLTSTLSWDPSHEYDSQDPSGKYLFARASLWVPTHESYLPSTHMYIVFLAVQGGVSDKETLRYHELFVTFAQEHLHCVLQENL